MTLNEDEQIDRYLSGQLPPEELWAFAERLEQDSALRRRVDLRKDLHSLHTSGELELSELLTGVDKEHFDEEPPAEQERPNRPWWLLPALLITAALAFLMMQRGNSAPVPADPSDAPQMQRLDTLPERAPLPANAPDTVKTAPAPTPSRSAPAASPKTTTPPTAKPEPDQSSVIAAVDPSFFTPNPALEDLLGTTRSTRGADNEIRIIQPALRPDGSLPMTALGQLAVLARAESTPAELVVYSNDPAEFLAGEALFTHPITGQNAVTVRGELRQTVTRPGLYYLLLIADNGAILASERLVLR